MDYLVKITPAAEQNLEDLIYFIALDSPGRADTFAKELVTSASNTLATFSESGTKYKGNIRKISYKGYTVFYRVNQPEKLVEIIHIVNLAKPLEYRGIDFNNESAD